MRLAYLFAIASIVASFWSVSGAAQDFSGIDGEREKQLQEMGVLLPDPESIRKIADEEFKKPIETQDVDVLKKLAKDANTFANLVGKLTNEYDDYYRANSRYDFVTSEITKSPALRAYQAADNRFKSIRNKAYFNLGLIYKNRGENMQAFLHFDDAFRLSVFDCDEGAADCLRYAAEKEMQALLGLEGEPYVYWKK